MVTYGALAIISILLNLSKYRIVVVPEVFTSDPLISEVMP